MAGTGGRKDARYQERGGNGDHEEAWRVQAEEKKRGARKGA